MKKIILLLFTLFSFTVSAQHLDPSNIPLPTSDMPSWANLMYERPLNLQKLNDAFRQYYKTHPFEKNNYTRFYKRLNKNLYKYCNEEGIYDEKEILEKNENNFSQNLDNQARSGAGAWTCIGPKETFWLKNDNDKQPACPWQVNIYSIAVAPSNNSILVSGSETGGLFKTIDKGKNWSEIGANFLFSGSTEAIAFHPTDANTFYVGNKNHILKTTDGGATLKIVYNNTDFYPNAIAVNPNNPNIILCSGDKGLVRSIDGGQNWSSILTTPCYDVKFNPSDPNLVYVLSKKTATKNFSEFLKSTDAGQSFTAITKGWATVMQEGIGRLAVSPANPNYIYAILLADNDTPILLKSIDKGENWTTTAIGKTTDFMMDNWQGYYDLAIMVSAQNAEHIIVGTSSAWKSTDGGKKFINLGGYGGLYPLHPDIQGAVSIGNDAWISTDGGVNYSADFFSTTPEARNNGITGSDFWGYSQGWNEDIMVGGRYHNGNTAMFENFPAGKALRMGGAEAGTGYVLHGRPRHVKYSDLGDGWVIPNKIDEKSPSRFIFSVTPNEDEYGFNAGEIEIDPSAYNTIFVTADSSLWRTTDGGLKFEELFKFPIKTKKIELSRSNPKVIYLNTDVEIYKSIDAGKSFIKLVKPTGFACKKMSMSINPLNEDELWISSPGGNTGSRIFKTIDGGKTWKNLSTALVANYALYNVAHHAGTDGGVYAVGLPNFGGNRKAKVFYRNNILTEWVDFSDGLTSGFDVLKTIPFYKGGKLRMAGSRGVWESPFYEKTADLVQLQPCVDKLKSECARDTFFFEDYSIYTGSLNYTWDFSPKPSFVSATNVRNPKVIFGKKGVYTATMTANGISKSLIINVENSCDIDSISGYALSLDGSSGTYAAQSKPMNLNSNTVTFSAWIKSAALQQDFAPVVMARGGTTTTGLNLTSKNELRYHWNDGGYGNSTKFIVPNNEWTHVAMVVSPTNVKIYMNGKGVTFNSTNPIEAFDTPMKIGADYSGDSRNFSGQIDEVCIFNRSLSQDEIRELMHLTKDITRDKNLVAYYQFNEKNDATLDKITVNHVSLIGEADKVISNAPVGYGFSKRLTINSLGNYNFDVAGTKMTFTGSSVPNGEVCVSKIIVAPDEKVSKGITENLYYVINNYGTNASFTGLTEITLEGEKNPADTKADYALYQRAFNAEGNTWKNLSVTPLLINGKSISFKNLNNLTSFGQLMMSKQNWAVKTDEVFLQQFSIFPNPILQNNSLFVKTSFAASYELKIYDAQGKKVFENMLTGNNELPNVFQSKGVYFYDLNAEGKTKSGKIVVE